jgi:hypothetical protein
LSELSPIRPTLLVLILIASCFAQSVSQAKASTRAIPRPDEGSISGNLYSNKFFDFTFEFPKDWIPHGQATNTRIMESAKERMASSEPAFAPELKVEERHTYNLLTVFENELGTPGVRFFRSEVLVAEDISFAPGIKSGKDYLLNGLPFLKKQGFQTFSEIKQGDIGGVTFYREDVTKRLSADITAYQAHFCTIVRGYALSLGVTTEDANETRKLVDQISLRFGSRATEPTAIATGAGGATTNPQESGSINSGVYRNTYFRITYHLPTDWYVDTRIFKERLAEKNDPAKRTFVLLSAKEFAPGTPGLKFNPDLALMADNASAYHHTVVTTGNDYLLMIRHDMVETLHEELIQQGAGINVGGHSFYRADYKRPLGYQAVVCTVWKGYVLVWTFVGETRAQLDELVKSMQDISFESH